MIQCKCKNFLFYWLFLVFCSSNAQLFTEKTGVNLKAKNNSRIYKFNPQEETIFFFDQETNKVEFVTSKSESTKFKLEKGKSGKWYSRNKNLKSIIQEAEILPEIERRTHINQPVIKQSIFTGTVVLLSVGLLLLIALARVFFQDAFYAFLVPFKAYTNTVEKIAQTNRVSILMAVLFFVYVLVALFFLLFPDVPFQTFLWNLGLLMGYFVIKWFAHNRANAVFGDSGFSRLHLLEYLRYGIFLFVVIYFTVLVITLNGLGVNFIYEIVLFPYLLVWFIRLWIIYYRRYNHNLLYFFSYLCATEVIPLFLMVFFWKSKI